MKRYKQAGKGWAKGVLLALFAFIFGVFLLPLLWGVVSGGDIVKADAATTKPCTVHYYQVEATVNENRTVDFVEEISFTMHMTPSQGSFYRSLPIEGDRFLNITAEGVGNDAFSYEVRENPEADGFLDINCYGGVVKGATLTYRFTYTMECHFSNVDDNGMRIDFVGGGWPFALENVDVKIHFPASLTDLSVHASAFGTSGNDYADVVEQTDTYLHLHAEELPLKRSSLGQSAVPITVEFSVVAGGLTPISQAEWSSPTLWVCLVVGLLGLAVAGLLVWKSSKKPILSTVVGFTAPKGMDPMELGYLLDGAVDNEDITSMIYYFASKGYLSISMVDGDPILKRKVECLPASESLHAATLFSGLFQGGRKETSVEDLTNRFYAHADKARVQIGAKRPKMYEKKSVWRFVLCAALALAVAMGVPALTGLLYVGRGYAPIFGGALLIVPIVLHALMIHMLENYRYKWKGGKRTLINVILIAILAIGAWLYMLFSTNVLTEVERALALVFAYLILLAQRSILMRREEYNETLGGILGFKEFILVTKKDRIEAMLETNPELFYDVLPYAQVMDVSNEWEGKFKDITIKPPSWYDGNFSLFDFWLINRSMSMMRYAMSSRPSSNGSSVGRGGGGGFSGGFSGGGGGGGGGGFR